MEAFDVHLHFALSPQTRHRFIAVFFISIAETIFSFDHFHVQQVTCDKWATTHKPQVHVLHCSECK